MELSSHFSGMENDGMRNLNWYVVL
jgi:hypothetical protein